MLSVTMDSVKTPYPPLLLASCVWSLNPRDLLNFWTNQILLESVPDLDGMRWVSIGFRCAEKSSAVCTHAMMVLYLSDSTSRFPESEVKLFSSFNDLYPILLQSALILFHPVPLPGSRLLRLLPFNDNKVLYDSLWQHYNSPLSFAISLIKLNSTSKPVNASF